MRELVQDWWWVLPVAVAVAVVVVRLVPPWRRRVDAYLGREVRAPRVVLVVQAFRDIAVPIVAVVVAILWWQAATRDEEADRNARIQSCSAEYGATRVAWENEAQGFDETGDKLYARIVRRAAEDRTLPSALIELHEQARVDAELAQDKASEMSLRQIGLAQFSVRSVMAGNDFRCPAIPDQLVVEGIEVG